MKKTLVIHPFLFSISFIVFLFSHNVGELGYNVSYDIILVPIFIVLSFAVLVFLISKIVIPNKQKAGVVSSLIVIFSLYYGVIYDIFKGTELGGFLIGRHKLLFPFWVLLIFAGIFLTLKSKKNLSRPTKTLNIFTVLVVLASVINILAYEVNKPEIKSQDHSGIKVDTGGQVMPDIYYIIPDMYAGNEVLKKYFDYDNKEFSDFLEKKGFKIAGNSMSNYNTTYLSLASTFNMKYINYLKNKTTVNPSDYGPILASIRENSVVRFLKEYGYKIIYFRIGLPINGADLKIGQPVAGEFTNLLLNSTIMRLVNGRKNVIRDYISFRIRASIDRALKRLGEVSDFDLGGPKFVYVHLPIPHWPYLFGPNGEKVAFKFFDFDKVNPVEEKEYYLGQLRYTNKKLAEAVDTILSNSETPPIIVIQSDHGFKLLLDEGETGMAASLSLKNFSAYYLPGKNKNVLPSDMTPVNTFRLIFDQYFGTELNLLENKTYFYDENDPNGFREVN